MDLDIAFSGEEAERCTQRAIVMFLSAINSLKGLFFVKSLFESLKVSRLQALVRARVLLTIFLTPPPASVPSASLVVHQHALQLSSKRLWTASISAIMLTVPKPPRLNQGSSARQLSAAVAQFS